MESRQENPVTFFARTNFRNESKAFGIKERDRLSHLYVVGKTGTGKSTLLETMIRQDIEHGRGCALLDPHGDLVRKIRAAVPKEREQDLVYFDAADPTNQIGFNPLERVPPLKRPLAASGLLDVFKKIWADSWGPRLEHILRHCLLALLEQEEATLADVLRLLTDPAFRKNAASRVVNEQVRDFWLREFAGYPAVFRAEAIAPIQNKVGAFLANPVLNRVLTVTKSSFDLRAIMDEGKILLVNLAKGRLGEDASALLGSLLVSRIGLAALSRADTPETSRQHFFLYLDEFQTFSTLALANMLAELRKYRVGMILAHQYTAQLEPEIRSAVLGNAATVVSFRLGLEDAEVLEREFYPKFKAEDLLNLPNYNIYLKLMIDGTESKPFSAVTIRADEVPQRERAA
jgi:type IV secretory pathway TraG/TraD family ATPase VirD4